VTGVGDTFSSGLDLNEFPTTADCQQTLSCTALQLVLAEMRDSPVPIVVALNGPAFAGGAGVALAADFLVLPEDAFLQFPGAGKGIVAEVLMPILVDTVGPRRGLDWLIRGKKIQAQELQMCGIAVEVVPKAELSQATRALCDLLEAIPATVFATHKQLLSRTLYQDDQAGLSWTHPFQPVIHFAPTSRLPGAR
ncbi:MAG: enoyl-CoA hydratase/isomerase family protein, partial [Phycisphaerae bacterium]